MNKLTKQLLSLGLSAVTVAGMVTPVLADDEVPTTTEPEATEVTDQPVDVVEQPVLKRLLINQQMLQKNQKAML